MWQILNPIFDQAVKMVENANLGPRNPKNSNFLTCQDIGYSTFRTNEECHDLIFSSGALPYNPPYFYSNLRGSAMVDVER